ncbi:HamA C-terminal domain-containing protein [Aquimarina longa]|uniref:HamA C-terminal domain-containing protein n=1 Tax=Aquimarina longa TaxID=1080221 RepID=UPI00078498D7|nr:DUF1837 domain-containing protein [Aquimarina longa]
MPKDLKDIAWDKLLKIDKNAFTDWFSLNEEVTLSEDVKVKFYSLNFVDGSPDYEGFIKHLYEQVVTYVFDEKDIEELIEDGDIPYKKALSYFGDIDPISDGRYGELILFLFVEAILQTPMVVHKISQTYNNNDQVKGSDGLFIGNILDKPTLLIGESKMRNNFHVCVGDVLDSLNRYINNPHSIDRELQVAKKHLSRDLNNLEVGDLDLIYQSLRTKQEEFKGYGICYPAFLMYKEVNLKKLIAKSLPDIEEVINKFINSVKTRRANYIEKTLPPIKGLTLEFFMMPVKDVNEFRESCYEIFHNGKKYKRE